MQVVERISQQVHETCCALGIAVVGGHTEFTSAVTQPVLVGTCMGPLLTDTPILTSGARAGDRIVLTKGAALEGVSILCQDRCDALVTAGVFGSAAEVAAVGQQHAAQLSVVADARIALGALPATGAVVSSMHDPTEGGIAGALHEMADASGKGFEIDIAAVPLSDAARRICAHFRVDPMQLISSGALVMCVSPAHVDALLSAFRAAHVTAADIGCVVADGSRRVALPSRLPLVRPDQDALWEALAQRV